MLNRSNCIPTNDEICCKSGQIVAILEHIFEFTTPKLSIYKIAIGSEGSLIGLWPLACER